MALKTVSLFGSSSPTVSLLTIIFLTDALLIATSDVFTSGDCVDDFFFRLLFYNIFNLTVICLTVTFFMVTPLEV